MPNIRQLMMAYNHKLLDMQEKNKQVCDCKKQKFISENNL